MSTSVQPAQPAPAAQPAAAQPAQPAEKKKIDTKDPHAVHDEFTAISKHMLETIASYSARMFGESNSYAKTMKLPADAPKKKELVHILSAIRGLIKDEKKLYNAKTRGNKRNEGGQTTKKTGVSRIVRCSVKLSKLLRLADWGLMSETHPGECYGTHGTITGGLANYVKLNALQNPDAPSFWSANDEVIETIGLETFARKGLDPKRLRFIDWQKLLAGDKEDPVRYPGHLTSIKKGTLDEKKENEIRNKCAGNAEGEIGGAVRKVYELRGELKEIVDAYGKHLRARDACREARPGQGVTAMWEAEIVADEANYVKKAAEVRKAAESFNFSISPAYPPKLQAPPVREKKPRVKKQKAGKTRA